MAIMSDFDGFDDYLKKVRKKKKNKIENSLILSLLTILILQDNYVDLYNKIKQTRERECDASFLFINKFDDPQNTRNYTEIMNLFKYKLNAINESVLSVSNATFEWKRILTKIQYGFIAYESCSTDDCKNGVIKFIVEQFEHFNGFLSTVNLQFVLLA